MPKTSDYNTAAAVNRFGLNQTVSGTTIIAAAELGFRHKVVGFMLSPHGSGTRTFVFQGSITGNLHGPVTVSSANQQNGLVIWQPLERYPFCRTGMNEALQITTTGDHFGGQILFLTEPA